uniref:Integumentary mucin C.1-like n=1 Tax=Crassostrea virginica TaxID=6565 RepID=A0A8B8E7M6_CRAVI|nr:integumentary mucin C.1-like [Crassostrea virginica]
MGITPLFLTFITFVQFSDTFLLDGVNDCQDDPTLKCWYYDDTQCRGVYEAFAREHCPLRCGYCPGKAPPCVDNIPDCADYGQEVCGNSAFQGFLRENCRKFCGFCTVVTTTTTTAIPSTTTTTTTTTTPTTTTRAPPKTTSPLPTGADCVDVRGDCQNHLHACLGVFRTWAIRNCARSCGYCTNSPPCEDTVDCVHLPASLCTDPALRDFATTSCRKFCKFCDNNQIQSANMTTQSMVMKTTRSSMTSSVATTTSGIKLPTKVASTASIVKDLTGADVFG